MAAFIRHRARRSNKWYGILSMIPISQFMITCVRSMSDGCQIDVEWITASAALYSFSSPVLSPFTAPKLCPKPTWTDEMSGCGEGGDETLIRPADVGMQG